MYDENNIFAKIISGKLKADKIYEDDYILAIKDINPSAPIHILIMPKGQYKDYSDFVNKASQHEIAHYFTKIAEIAIGLNLTDQSYKLVSNKGSFSNQTILHFHTHLLGGKKLEDHL